MKRSRRDFVRVAGIAGTTIIAGGINACHPEPAEITFHSPIDGDMLTDADGDIVDGALHTKVQVKGSPGSKISINGISTSFADGVFTSTIPLKGYENSIEVTETRSKQKQRITVYWLKNITGKYRLSLDDNILFLKDINANARKYSSVFENPYLGFLKEVHDRFGTKVHLNIYYQTEGFNLSQMTDKFRDEWRANAGWLRLSFHALQNDPDRPYLNAVYDQVKKDCVMVMEQIRRFAGEELMGPVTTLHWGAANLEGTRALRDCGYKALAGYFVVVPGEEPVSYYLPGDKKLNLSRRIAWRDNTEGIIFSRINIVINSYKLEEIVPYLDTIKEDPHRSAYMDLMIHEQYFYPDYRDYQPDYREKVMTAVRWADEHGYKPAFLSECLFQ